ncbi:MAG: DUF342 domain-containing protein [Desulfamplus sp.]|nr:DUF342 domain-containing protein [Desulfamplus sp.]
MPDKKTILIVDDQESIIKALRRLLLSEGYDILSAPDGPSALKLITNSKDKSELFLIISDQRMPEMTGTQFLEKTMDILPDAIRFILSGYADRDDVNNAFKKGVVHKFLNKPWNNDELLILISQAYESPEKLKTFASSDSQESGLPNINIMDKEIKKFYENHNNKVLGKLAVYHGFITQEQLDTALTIMQSEQQAGRNVALENILFEKGLVSSENIGKILATTRRRVGKIFGKIAIKNFGVSQTDIERCLAIQSKEFSDTSTCRLLGDILVSEKILTEEQKESIVIDQVYSETEVLRSGIAGSGVNSKVSDDTGSRTTDTGSRTAGNRSTGNTATGNSGTEYTSTTDSTKTEAIKGDGTNDIQMPQNELILNKRKKNFFRRRALDKIFCKSAINRNYATEQEVLKALEEQLLHFTKTFELKLVKDILIEHSIISKDQAEIIIAATSHSKPSPDSVSGVVNTASSPQVAASGTEKITGTEKGEGKITDTGKITGKEKIIGTEQTVTNSEKTIYIGEKNAFELTLSPLNIEASIRLIGTMPEIMDTDRLKVLLAENQIVYGLASDVAIELFLQHAAEKKEKFIIAKGRHAKPGRDALVKYYFEDENTRFGKELSSGKFDYRERGEILNVTQGSILAEKIPFIPPVNAITVFGTEIPEPAPLDLTLTAGKGVGISQDGLKAIALVSGRPDMSLGGKISIMSEKLIKGNVDFKTGNVKFLGDIIVQGTILAGFSVMGNNLTVNDIEEAEINVANTLIVKNSINNSNIKVGGNITAQFIKKSTVFANCDVVVMKEIIDSTIITSGRVIVQRGRIMSSIIHAAKGIEAMNIGSEVSSPCQLFLGSNHHSKGILDTLSQKIDYQQEYLLKLEALNQQYDQKSIQQLNSLADVSRIQERLFLEKQKIMEEQKGVTNAIVKKQMDDFLVDLNKKLLKMDETINKLFDDNEIMQTNSKEIKVKIKTVKTALEQLKNEKIGFETWYEDQQKAARVNGINLLVQGTVTAGTVINGTESSMIVKNPIKNSKIRQVINSENINKIFHEIKVELMIKSGKMHA